MYTSLLVPLDGSRLGEKALPYAEAIATADGSALHLAHVHEVRPPTHLLENTSFHWEGVDMREYDVRDRKREGAYLAEVERRVKSECSVPVDSRLLEGDVVRSLERHARDVDAGLIVLSGHGRSGAGHGWVGHVTDAILRHGGPPVLLAPADGVTDAHPATFRKVLVCLDGSMRDQRLVDAAMALASVTGARVTLLGVVVRPTLMDRLRHTGVMIGHHNTSEAVRYLDDLARELRAEGHQVSVRVEAGRHAAPEILRVAASQNADLIALGTRGQGRAARSVLGSVCEAVARGSDTPLLIVGRKPAEA